MKYPHYVYMVMIEWYWCEVKQLNIENNGIKLIMKARKYLS